VELTIPHSKKLIVTKVEQYCSTGQSTRRDVAPTEEEYMIYSHTGIQTIYNILYTVTQEYKQYIVYFYCLYLFVFLYIVYVLYSCLNVCCTMCIVCILLRHPDEGRRSERNMSVNSNAHMMYICLFVTHVQDILRARIWNICSLSRCC
jgi:hypothetical protein